MHAIAPAKINLSLHITGKRPDGYHNLDSMVAFCDFGDEITIKSAKTTSLTVTGPFAKDCTPCEDNLVLKAVELLKNDAKIDDQHVAITLGKQVPVGAGMGGGSSDAATTLLMVSSLWNLNYTPDQLMTLSAPLGADVPMCIPASMQHATGIGQDLTPITCHEPLYALLAFPKTPLSTASIYKHQIAFSAPDTAPKASFNNAQDMLSYLNGTSNDLTPYAILEAPIISELIDTLNQLNGCKLARMTGSGACCFGIFTTQKEANAASIDLRSHHPTLWIKTTKLK